MNQLEALINKLKNTTSRLSKKNVSIKKKRRPTTKRITMKYGKNKKCTKCRNCGCNYSKGKKSKVTLIRRIPNKKMLTKVVSINNNNSNHINRPNNITRRNIRTILNRIISRKNPTRSQNLATLIQNMSTRTNNHQHNNQPNQVEKSKTVKSYYITVSNGSTKMEKGRRIEDDSTKPFIEVNMLNNGQLKEFRVQRQ